MRRLIVLLAFIVPLHKAFAQNIKSKINALYFGVPESSEKFDIKAIFNRTENFYAYSEYNRFGMDNISVKFEENPEMTFIGQDNGLKIYFTAHGKFDQLVILSRYTSSDLNKCENQVKEILKKFEKISFRVNKSDSYDGEQNLIGRGYSFYSSVKSYNNRKSYFSIIYRLTPNQEYELDLHFYPANLY
jgi:hypothetical protein